MRLSQEYYHSYNVLSDLLEDSANMMEQGAWLGNNEFLPRRLVFTSPVTSKFTLPEQFRLYMYISLEPCIGTSIGWLDDDENGYLISFKANNEVSLEKSVSGALQTLVTADISDIGVVDGSWFFLEIDRYRNGIINVRLQDTTIFECDDATYIEPDTYYFCITPAESVSMQFADLLILYCDRAEYQRSLCWPDEYPADSVDLIAPQLHLSGVFETKYAMMLLPQEGYALQFKFENTQYDSFKILLCSPDKKKGIYIEFFEDAGYKYRLVTMGGDVLATSDEMNGIVTDVNIYCNCASYLDYIRVEANDQTIQASYATRYLTRGAELILIGNEADKEFYLNSCRFILDSEGMDSIHSHTIVNSMTDHAKRQGIVSPLPDVL